MFGYTFDKSDYFWLFIFQYVVLIFEELMHIFHYAYFTLGITSFMKELKLGSHRAIPFWRYKLKLSPLLFSGDSDIFKAIFPYMAQ